MQLVQPLSSRFSPNTRRSGDNDPRNGPSSLQKFGGEDLGFGIQLHRQQTENAHAWAGQHAVRAAAEAAAAAADRTMAQLVRFAGNVFARLPQ